MPLDPTAKPSDVPQLAPSELDAHVRGLVPELGLAATAVPLVPEIRLWLLPEELPAGRLPAAALGGLLAAPPYWAFCWGSGAVLARYLLDHPEVVRGRTVLDVGTGSGVVAVAAALAGARRVVASDQDPRALLATRANAALNGVRVGVDAGTLDGAAPVDVIVAADVLYDADNASLPPAFRKRAASVLVADSRIAGFPFPGYAPAWTAECRVVPDLVEAPSVNRVTVYRAERFLGGDGA